MLDTEITKTFAKSHLINAIKAVPDSLVKITLIKHDKVGLVAGKTTIVQIPSVKD